MIKIVIFDFDDTLIDNRELDYQGFRIPCKRLGLKIPSKKKILFLRGKGLLAEKIVTLLCNNQKLKKDFLEIRKNFIHSKETVPFLKLKIGTKLILETLKKKDIICFISSVRTNKNTINKFLKEKKIEKLFKGIYLPNDIKLKISNTTVNNRILIKTSIIKYIIKKFLLKTDEIIFIGNNNEDYKSASKIGVKFIFFKNQYLSDIKYNNIIKVKTMKELKIKLEKLLDS